jgi:hypothetical protein
MARKLLLAVLLLSLVIELGLTGGLLFARETTSKAFGVGLTADTSFLAYILGWLCGFASMMLCLAIFWIGIGIGIYAGFGKPDNLLIDTLKGCLIVGLTWWSQRSVVR